MSFAVIEAEKRAVVEQVWGQESLFLNKRKLLCVFMPMRRPSREGETGCRREGTDVESCPRHGMARRHGQAGGRGRGSLWKFVLFCFFMDVGSGHQEHVRLGKGV